MNKNQVNDNSEILTRYLKLSDQLETALAGLAKSGFSLARSPEAWTIHWQMVHHVVNAHAVTKIIIMRRWRILVLFSNWHDMIKTASGSRCWITQVERLPRLSRLGNEKDYRRATRSQPNQSRVASPRTNMLDTKYAGTLIIAMGNN